MNVSDFCPFSLIQEGLLDNVCVFPGVCLIHCTEGMNYNKLKDMPLDITVKRELAQYSPMSMRVRQYILCKGRSVERSMKCVPLDFCSTKLWKIFPKYCILRVDMLSRCLMKSGVKGTLQRLCVPSKFITSMVYSIASCS